jgi:hypothetical protein
MHARQMKSTGNILSITIDADVTDKRYAAIVKELDRIVSDFGTVKLVLVMKDYVSFNSAEDFCDNLRFVQIYADRIERAVVLGDRELKRTLTGLFGLFSGVKMAFFTTADLKAAWNWLNGLRSPKDG